MAGRFAPESGDGIAGFAGLIVVDIGDVVDVVVCFLNRLSSLSLSTRDDLTSFIETLSTDDEVNFRFSLPPPLNEDESDLGVVESSSILDMLKLRLFLGCWGAVGVAVVAVVVVGGVTTDLVLLVSLSFE